MINTPGGVAPCQPFGIGGKNAHVLVSSRMYGARPKADLAVTLGVFQEEPFQRGAPLSVRRSSPTLSLAQAPSSISLSWMRRPARKRCATLARS